MEFHLSSWYEPWEFCAAKLPWASAAGGGFSLDASTQIYPSRERCDRFRYDPPIPIATITAISLLVIGALALLTLISG